MNQGSEIITVHLRKETPDQPLGFRLQGGADFTTPLSIQSVNPGSCADRCGLRSGDAVLSINDRPSDEIEHDEAKRIIQLTGGQITMVVQRGAVSVWKPSVTPLSQLKPQGSPGPAMGGGPAPPPGGPPAGGDDPYVQRTSLAANKQEIQAIGTGHNRTARPFAGFGGGSSFSPAAPPQSQPAYTPPSQPAYTPPAPPPPPPQQQQPSGYGANQYAGAQHQDSSFGMSGAGQYSSHAGQQQQQQQQHGGGYDMPNMGGLKIEDGSNTSDVTTPSQENNPSNSHARSRSFENTGPNGQVSPLIITPTMLAVQSELNKQELPHRPVSPRYAALDALVNNNDGDKEPESSHNPLKRPIPTYLSAPSGGDRVRSISPTLMLIQQEEGMRSQPQEQQQQVQPSEVTPAQMVEHQQGEEIHYHGYMDHNKQSRSFKALQAEVSSDGNAAPPPPAAASVSGMRSVRAPTTKAPSEKAQGVYMTCNACGTLIAGVFVKISGEPMHPECFKCVDCGKNLKNQGYFRVNERLYCDVHARTAAAPPPGSEGDMYATPVYR